MFEKSKIKMKLSLIQTILLVLAVAIVCTSSCALHFNKHTTDSDQENSPSRVKRRFLNSPFGFALNVDQLRRMQKHFKEQENREKKREEERNKIFRNNLASRASSSFLRDFYPMRT